MNQESKQSSVSERIFNRWAQAVPPDKIHSVCEYGRQNVRLPGSARSEEYDPDISPWTCEPIERANDGTQVCTVIKPAQTGGSVVGEVVLCFWLSTRQGDCAYFWPNDLAADGRWLKRFEKILLACKPLMARVPADRFKWQKGLVLLPSGNLEVKGVRTDRAVSSDTIPYIVNEELHDVEGGWEGGKLAQVYTRQSACWRRCCFNISNAGFTQSDLHKAALAGTWQHWTIKCPGCGQPHRMRCRWEESRPDLGGLRYDAKGCRLGNFDYDYPRLVANGIFYQMPCGYKLRDDLTERRMLSRSGKYGDPENKGALLTERSYTYEAVACDWYPWLEIIKRKHAALKAMSFNDYKPYFDYLREVECHFVDIGKDRPAPERTVIVTSEKPKNREGLVNRAARLAMLDWQRGHMQAGETPHYWLLIQDWDQNANSLVVFEGRVDTDGEANAILKEHRVDPVSVVVDSSWDTERIYALCLKYGYNCLKADDKAYWNWEDGTSRFYSQPRPLYAVANTPPSQADPAMEPTFWLVSKYTSMERLVFLRQSKTIKYEVPSDVSKDFIEQFDSWTVEVLRQKDGQSVMKWRQTRDADHLWQCACGILSMVDLLGGFDGAGGMPGNVPQPAEPAPSSS